MDNTYIKERFEGLTLGANPLADIRRDAFRTFDLMGIPTVRHEEWKYTRISSLFNKEFQLQTTQTSQLQPADIDKLRLPGYQDANQLVFVNGYYAPQLSDVRSSGLTLVSLEEAAANQFAPLVREHFNHSSKYLKDGINALNTAFIDGGIFLHIEARKLIKHPVYIYNITDARDQAVLSQPRSLVFVSEGAQVQLVETYITLGESESMTNQVMEIIVDTDALLDYYKLQNDRSHASQVSTTHLRQIGKSVTHCVTVSLNGGIVRNNLHAVLDARYAEAHLYGLYYQGGQSHVDNHTIVDNVQPDCLSNELYKGILDNQSTGVFNGKIYVQKDAQKTNAFQSNKNVLLSETANVNTKPQLEIFADDVKCSHGCTIGSLDEEGLFYLQSRGIPRNQAMALLLQGFAVDILDKIKPAPIRAYIEDLITHRLTVENV
ncbi:MAG: Fe-S cluster assembly protein SufD [Chitinophagaceae bacterium]|nr:MAG: Fe-S cluster assembly protein SufD [Chitinophagaceae bacterium]